MRILTSLSMVMAAALSDITAGQATEGPWCLKTRFTVMADCSIPSQQQCIFAALPENGACWPNPNYRGPIQPSGRSATRKRNY
jgi:hypothetical protein